ncbi:hypothetical protein ZWY2020_010628 [Hordeum vulgare]|nr:hypothetical protein ZWY2020_010628 [Hordeum vulgare]
MWPRLKSHFETPAATKQHRCKEKEKTRAFLQSHTRLPLPRPLKRHSQHQHQHQQQSTTHANAKAPFPDPNSWTTGCAHSPARPKHGKRSCTSCVSSRRARFRRAVSTIRASAAPATPCGYSEDDDPFFDLDLSCCSAPASSAESSSEFGDSSCAGEPLRGGGAPLRVKFCTSEPSDADAQFSTSSRHRKLRTLSFGSAKAAFYGGRAGFSRSSNSRRSARLFAAFAHGSPDQDQEEAKRTPTPSADVIRRCLSKISRRLRRVAPGAAAVDIRLRKSRSVSTAQSSPPCRDDSLVEKQDGIASAIAHCKESIHRASISEGDSSLLRSRSDPGT